MTKSLLDAAMNAATLARNPAGEPMIGPSLGLSAGDVKRARDILATMPEDPLTTAFDRRDYLIAHDWRPEQEARARQSQDSARTFAPSPDMISAAEDVFKAMAYVGTIRPIVVKYQTEILQQGQWRIRPKYADRLGDKVILDPEDSYLMSEEDLAVYIDRCKVARNQAGLRVDHDGQCPLLVAETLLGKAKRALLDVMEPVTRLPADRLLNAGMDKYNSGVELTLQLLAPFVNPKLEKPGEPSPAEEEQQKVPSETLLESEFVDMDSAAVRGYIAGRGGETKQPEFRTEEDYLAFNIGLRKGKEEKGKEEAQVAARNAGFDALFDEAVEDLKDAHPDLEDSETVAGIKENVRDDFKATGDALQDHLQLRGAIEEEIERVEFTDKLRM